MATQPTSLRSSESKQSHMWKYSGLQEKFKTLHKSNKCYEIQTEIFPKGTFFVVYLGI